MHNIFISYVSEDAQIARQIAEGLEAAGFLTWYYQRDNPPFVDYLASTGQAIEEAQAMMLILSENSLTNSRQIHLEVVRAHESGRLILPVLLGVTWEDFQHRQPSWRQAVASSNAVTWDAARAQFLLERMVAGLQALGIKPQGARKHEALPYPPAGDRQETPTPQAEPQRSRQETVTPVAPQELTGAKPVVLNIARDGRLFHFSIEQPGDEKVEAGSSEYSVEVIPQSEEQLSRTMDKLICGTGAAYRLESLGSLLFSTLLPLEVQTFLQNYNGPLVLSTRVPEIPWELFYDRDIGQFLGLKNPVGRRLLTSRAVKRREGERRGRSAFLLVGNPRNDLEGSATEVNQLADLMTGCDLRVEVLTGDRADYASVSMELQNDDYLGIHFAGHAAYEPKSQQFALLLADGGILPAADISNVLRGRPFVFLNACETDSMLKSGQPAEGWGGSQGWRATEGLVTAFIQGGAAAVIGTRWTVNDLVAREFAASFYHLALAGMPVGEALRQARLAMRQQWPGDNNWAAFVLYGDPLMTLKLLAKKTDETRPPVEQPEARDKNVEVATAPAESGLFTAAGMLNLARFEPGLAKALGGMPQESFFLGHDLMGAPHLLITLLNIPDGVAQQSFRQAGLEPSQARDLLRGSIQTNLVPPATPPLARQQFSERGILSLEGAEQEAAKDGAALIAERHLLAAILGIDEGVTARVLDSFEGARRRILSLLRKGYVEVEHPLVLAEDARQIMLLALNEAYTAGRKSIETPHFIIALTKLPEGRTARALLKQGIELEDLREAMRELMPPAGPLYQGPKTLNRDLLSARLRDIVEIAEAEAYTSGVSAVSEVHLVTGLARVSGSLTTEMLRLAGVDLDQLLADAQALPGMLPAAPGLETARAAAEISAGQSTCPYSRAVIEVLKVAQAEAFRLGYPRVETPFLFMALGIIRGGCMEGALRQQGFDAVAVVNQMRARMAVVGIPLPKEPLEVNGYTHDVLSDRVKNILKIAEDEARALGACPVSEAHLVVGLLKSQGGKTTQYLQRLGLDLQAMLEFSSARAREQDSAAG